jgi:hypothetical protein
MSEPKASYDAGVEALVNCAEACLAQESEVERVRHSAYAGFGIVHDKALALMGDVANGDVSAIAAGFDDLLSEIVGQKLEFGGTK